MALLTCRETYVKAEPGESPNNRNDRAIRVAAAWYAQKLPSMPVLLISNDADNLRRARAEGLNAMGIQVSILPPPLPTSPPSSPSPEPQTLPTKIASSRVRLGGVLTPSLCTT